MSPANRARFFATELVGTSLGETIGVEFFSDAGVPARDTKSPVMPSVGYSCPSPPSYGSSIGTWRMVRLDLEVVLERVEPISSIVLACSVGIV
jgi:hypothetical protein